MVITRLKKQLYENIEKQGIQFHENYEINYRLDREIGRLYTDSKLNIRYYHYISKKFLEQYLQKEKRPTSAMWNRIANQYGYLSSLSLEYIEGISFKRICMKLKKQEKSKN